jgi:hypothetical protein
MQFTVSDFMRVYRGSVRLIAGESGLARPISEVGILDYELMPGLRDKYERLNLAEGQLVLSTFLYAKDDSYLVSEAVRTLVASGASALVVKNVLHLQIPDAAVRYANARNLPLIVADAHGFLFDHVIVDVSERVRDLGSSTFVQGRVDAARRRSCAAEEVRACALAVNPSFDERIVCAYAQVEGAIDDEADRAIGRAFLSSELHRLGTVAFVYRGGVLLAVTCDPEKALDASEIVAVFQRDVLLPLDAVQVAACVRGVGASSVQVGLELFGRCVREALWAAERSAEGGGAPVGFDALGIDRVLLPFAHEPELVGFSRAIVEPLRAHDAAHNGQLVATLEAFAAYGCNVARTAEALGQHQNTVRYRLDAIGRLTGLSPREPADMEQLDVALRLARMESGR